MDKHKRRYRLYSETESFKVLYVDGFRTHTYITRRTCRENGAFWVEWRVYSRDAIGEFRVGTGYTLPQAREIAINYHESNERKSNHG